MSDHPNAVLVKRVYEAMANRDVEAFEQLHTDDCVLHVSGHGRLSRDAEGRAGVLGVFREGLEAPDFTVRTRVHDVLASDDHAVALVHAIVERGDRSIDQPLVQVFHCRDGKVSEIWEYLWDQEADARFWSR